MSKFTIFSVVLTLVLIGAFVIFASSSNSKQGIVSSSNYSKDSKQKPTAVAPKTSEDLGKMKVSDEKYADFLLENKGNRPLQITRITSSCNCTFGKILYEGKESEEYGMHSRGLGVAGEIAPGKTATVRVIYRPFIMPVYGFIEREVYIETNDPSNSNLTFKVTATVN